MKIHKSLLIGLVAATSLAGLSLSTAANAEVSIYFSVPPPPVRVEVVPAPRHGYIWVPGYWDLYHDNHVWRKAHWEQERHGYYYAPSAWVHHGDRWELHRGHWNKGDRDHDGIPNHYDHDRDGDGTPNRYDGSPDNSHRH
jgi:hypothetical protein